MNIFQIPNLEEEENKVTSQIIALIDTSGSMN